jgi:hypothetical protein
MLRIKIFLKNYLHVVCAIVFSVHVYLFVGIKTIENGFRSEVKSLKPRSLFRIARAENQHLANSFGGIHYGQGSKIYNFPYSLVYAVYQLSGKYYDKMPFSTSRKNVRGKPIHFRPA